MKNRTMNRRQALKTIGSSLAIFSPVQMLASTIVSGICTKAAAATAAVRPRNYLMINMYGGPARWGFDSPLLLNGNESLIANPMVVTRFSSVSDDGGATVEMDYATHDVGGLIMPYMWGFDVPRARTGSRPMADLMSNMLILRGFNMGLDGHSINNTRIVTPVPGGPCLNGLVADAASASIPAINVGLSPGASAYYAPRGTGIVDVPVDHENYLDFLFAPFVGAEVDLLRDRAHIDATVEQALAALRDYSVAENPAADTLFRDRSNAESLLRGSIDGFRDVYLDLTAKYEELITRSVQDTRLPGLTDKPIRGLVLPYVAPGDMTIEFALGKFSCETRYLGNEDLRTIFKSATIAYLSKQMALAEYVLTNGLSSSVMINPGPLSNLYFENCPTKTEVQKSRTPEQDSQFALPSGAALYTGTEFKNQFRTDPHFTGTYMTLLGHALYFRGMASCLIELIDQLRVSTIGGVSVFDETVIHLAAEFDRTPRLDGSGSDHGWLGNTASIFSGVIGEPMVLGNIYNKLDLVANLGTWGEGAPVRGLRQRIMNLGNVLSSLAMMLRAPSPTPNDRPVIAVDGLSTIATIERAHMLEYSQ